MRSLPLTNAAGPGGRPRETRAPSNAFAEWLASCGLTPEEVQAKLTKILRRLDPARWKDRKLSISMVYNARNAYARPGRDLAVAIAELSEDAVSVASWAKSEVRPRKPQVRRKRAKRSRSAPVDKAA